MALGGTSDAAASLLMSKFPRSHALYLAGVKCDRAKVHINALKKSIALHQRDPFGLGSIKNRQPGRPGRILGSVPLAFIKPTTLKPGRVVLPEKQSPVVWALIISDAANNLRATLDFMIHQLAVQQLTLKGLTREPRDVSFPICEYPGDKRGQFEWIVENRLSDVLPSALSDIEYFQPYHRRNRPKNDLLAILRELSNKTKHRFLIQPYLVGGVPGIYWGKVWLEWLHDGNVKLVGNRANDAGEEERFYPELSFKVSIEIPSLISTEYDISILDGIHAFIRDDILPCFARFF